MLRPWRSFPALGCWSLAILAVRGERAVVDLDADAVGHSWSHLTLEKTNTTGASSKRGIAITNHKLSAAALKSLASVVSWGYTWSPNPGGGGPSLGTWEDNGVRFMPMVWGKKDVNKALPKGAFALLGFNEPNFPEQAHMSPEEAAELWPQVEEMAKKAGIKKIVSPAMGLWGPGPKDPMAWMKKFIAVCSGCKIDAIAVHFYFCHGAALKSWVNKLRVFKKPIWITEFCCSEPSGKDRLSVEGQIAYMNEAIPFLEKDEDVEMYAWFSLFKKEWKYPIVPGDNGDAGLVYPDGRISQLGEHYSKMEPKAAESSGHTSGDMGNDKESSESSDDDEDGPCDDDEESSALYQDLLNSNESNSGMGAKEMHGERPCGRRSHSRVAASTAL